MFGHIPIRPRQEQAPICVMSARRPQLLAIDDPASIFQSGVRDSARKVGAAARFTEELTPTVSTGQSRRQKLPLLRLGAMGEQSLYRQVPCAGPCDAHCTGAPHLVFND